MTFNTGQIIDNSNVDYFVAALCLKKHPLVKKSRKVSAKYYIALEYIAKRCTSNPVFVNERLLQYKKALFGNVVAPKPSAEDQHRAIRKIIFSPFKPWLAKYRFLLLCDLALVLLDKSAIQQAYTMLAGYLSSKQASLIHSFWDALLVGEPTSIYRAFTNDLIMQLQANWEFVEQVEQRYIVTANVSAGKSTLINALVGKPVRRTSQETCTSYPGYIYSKPFKDGLVHLSAERLVLNATYDELMLSERDATIDIASYFCILGGSPKRICIIDTPGANSAIYREHGRRVSKTLREESYNKLIYIFNANRLGTDEEFRHLKFIADNVEEKKIIFVLNKLDEFNKRDDSIKESIKGVRDDLSRYGYKNPTICPLSACYAFLIKKKLNGYPLTSDELDEYSLYANKFSKSEHDLSQYYPPTSTFLNASHDRTLDMAVKCGLYGFENILYGGANE